METVDQRNPYHNRVAPGNVGFSFSPAGRAYLERQWSQYGMDKLSADLIASLILYGEEGPIAETSAKASEPLFVLREGGAWGAPCEWA